MGTHKITSLSRKNLFSVQNKSHPRYQSFEKVQKWSQIKRPGAVKKRTNSCSKISPEEVDQIQRPILRQRFYRLLHSHLVILENSCSGSGINCHYFGISYHCFNLVGSFCLQKY